MPATVLAVDLEICEMVKDVQDKLEAGIAQGCDYWIAQVRFSDDRRTVKIKTMDEATVHTVTLATFQQGWIAMGYLGLDDHEWDDDHADAALQKTMFNDVVFG